MRERCSLGRDGLDCLLTAGLAPIIQERGPRRGEKLKADVIQKRRKRDLLDDAANLDVLPELQVRLRKERMR
jgi:hypothetical protein